MVITLYDYLLFPLYFFLLQFIVLKKAEKYKGSVLRKYFLNTFYIHIAGCFIHSLVLQYYYGYGDAFGYFDGGHFIKQTVFTSGKFLGVFFLEGESFTQLPGAGDISAYTYGNLFAPSSLSAMKFMGFFSILSFSHFLINALFFGFISFIGTWKLFCVFNDISKRSIEKPLAFAMIFTPTIWFWGSGAGKDSLALGFVGILIYSLYKLFIKKERLVVNIIIVLLSLYFLSGIKVALVGITLAAGGAYFVVNTIQKSKNVLARFFLVLFAIGGITGFIFASINTIENSVAETALLVQSNIDNYGSAESDESQGGFKPMNFDISAAGIILATPVTVFSTLYRPFLWEAKKPIMFLSALESLVMFLSFFYVVIKARFFGFFRILLSDPAVLFCFIFCTLMAMIVGFTTFNFGTLVRYRLPLLPFYIFMILLLNLKIQLSNKNKK